MALTDLTTLDLWFLLTDLVIIAMVAIIYFFQGNTFSKCRKIEIDDYHLHVWRFFLYATIYTTWIAAFFIFVDQYLFRHVLHIFFVIGVSQMLETSIPAYVCKYYGFGGTCNCDFYKYNDFTPMLVFGTAGNLIFSFIELDTTGGLILLAILFGGSLIIYGFLPERDIEPLKYPPYMMISEIDELQEYLMSNPDSKKMLTILDAKCDFCEIQVDEIMQAPDHIKRDQLRIYDLTYSKETDPIIPMHLNLNSMEKIPVPTTIIFGSGGMIIEQKDGVLSKTEIVAILST